MAASYSLILSKGTHLVDESTRRLVLEAIESGERLIEIPVDRFHDGTTTAATVVTAHVIALFAHERPDDVELPPNVTAIGRRP
jgi:hypothetical protein